MATSTELDKTEEERLLDLLRTRGLSIKHLDDRTRESLRAVLQDMHVVRGVSLSDIAKRLGNKTSGYTSWLCKQLGVEARPFEEARLKGIREKRRKYERRPFDGTDEDKSYLLGLKHGDLTSSKPWREVVRVTTSTTHPAMARLFDELFRDHGHVYRYPRFKKDTGTYEWNLTTILDNSFDFLTWTFERAWRWIVGKESRILAYVAGFLDAEGHIGIYRNKNGVYLLIAFYNTNLGLLKRIKYALVPLGFSFLGPYLEKRKGTRSSKFGIERKKDYWKIVLSKRDVGKRFLVQLPIRHEEKLQRREIYLGTTEGQRWGDLEAVVLRLRDSIRKGRDEFVEEARRQVEIRKSRV